MRKTIHTFIKYPILGNVLLVAIFLFGWVGYKSLTTTFFPLIPSKTIIVQAIYPGASPEEIEEAIVLKVEDNLKGITGIERVTSVSSGEVSQPGSMISPASTASAVLSIVVGFMVLLGYPALSEWLWQGRTVGKLALGLRVVTLGGGPIAARDDDAELVGGDEEVGLYVEAPLAQRVADGDLVPGLDQPAVGQREGLAARAAAKVLQDAGPLHVGLEPRQVHLDQLAQIALGREQRPTGQGVARRHHRVALQPNVALLVKVLVILEGTSLHLDREVNLEGDRFRAVQGDEQLGRKGVEAVVAHDQVEAVEHER